MSFLQNKTFIVTGASLGVGRALCEIMAANGAQLVLNARTPGPLEEAAEACAAISGKAMHTSIAGSAADPAIASALVEEALDLGNFHGFIHVAGVFHPGPNLWELPSKQFHEIFEASVTAAYELIRSSAPFLMAQQEGIAVYFGSGAADRAQTGIAAYCAAKAAEEHLMRQFANEAPDITSFVYRPGIVETRMQQQARTSTGGGSEALKEIFIPWKEEGQLLTPQESATALISILEDNPRQFHGKIATPLDAPGASHSD